MQIGLDDKEWEEYVLNKQKEYFDLAYSFLKCADNLIDEFTKKGITKEELGAEGFVLSFLFAKSYKTIKASLLLCKKGYPEDALILTRANFEAVLWALYIIKNKEKASEKAKAFINYDAIDKEKRLKKILNMYEAEDGFKLKFQNALKKVKEKLPDTKDECKKICELANLNVFDLAKDVKLMDILYRTFYWESSNYAHSRAGCSNSYVSQSNGHLKFLLIPSEKGIRNVLIHLSLFLWYLMDKFNFLFELGSEKILASRLTELDEFIKNIDPKD